jgi:hypothetical protein
LIQIKAPPDDRANISILEIGSRPMPIETIVATGAIAIPFILFAVVLFWGELQTRGIGR